VDGTNITVNGLFTLEGLSSLPSAAVTAINNFVEDNAADAIKVMVEQFSDMFNVTAVRDVRLGFGETPGWCMSFCSAACSLLLARHYFKQT
jgi:hypothetical protein